MNFQIKKAERKKVKLKIAISSPSGGGKTYSALKLARGLSTSWEKVCVIDTENGSASLYSDLGAYNVLDMPPPYSPENYIAAIHKCLDFGMETIVIDSISHEWSGTGGALDIQAQLGGRFTDWAKITPRHKKLFDTMLHVPCNIIATVRTKTEWSVEKDEKGKSSPVKLGLKSEQREGIEYEFTIAWRLNQNHLASCDKDRTGLFSGRPEFIIDEKTGLELLRWSDGGADVTPPRVASIYDGSTEHQEKIKSILLKQKVPQEKWHEIDEKMIGKLSTKLDGVIKEVMNV